MKRLTPRIWTQAIEKRQLEGDRCRVCRSPRNVQLAHITGRTHDTERPLRDEGDWREMVVHPDRVVPLCQDHHRQYDSHRLDLLPWLTVDEVLQAVADSASGRSNGLELARKRICGNDLPMAAVAQQLGHSPTMTLATYGHVIREVEGTQRPDR